jgi:hypothetical protein
MATLAEAAMSRLGLVAAGGSGWGTPLDWLPVAAWVAALLWLVRLPRVKGACRSPSVFAADPAAPIAAAELSAPCHPPAVARGSERNARRGS